MEIFFVWKVRVRLLLRFLFATYMKYTAMASAAEYSSIVLMISEFIFSSVTPPDYKTVYRYLLDWRLLL